MGEGPDTQVPAVMGNTAPIVAPNEQRLGFDDPVDQGDLIIPRVKLMQGLSPELKDESLLLRQGQIINSLTKEVLPQEFVVIKKSKFWIRFNPRKAEDHGFDPNYKPGAFIWKSSDPNDERVKQFKDFGPNGERPLCTAFLNFLVLFNGVTMPVMLSFCNTSYKSGKDLLSHLQFGGGNIFSRKFKLTSFLDSNPKGDYYSLKVIPAGNTDGDLYAKAVATYNDFNKVDLSEHVAASEQQESTGAPY